MKVRLLAAAALVAVAWAAVHAASRGSFAPPARCPDAGRLPRLRPDYGGVTLPPNIAPLNFVVEEPGERFHVRVSGGAGRPFEVGGGRPEIRMPQGAWRALLSANRGGEVRFDVAVGGAAGWQRFETVRARVAPEPIDSRLVYRRIAPAFNLGGEMGIYERDLTGFGERALITSTDLKGGCVNCHTFRNNRPDTLLLHLRPISPDPSMLITRGGKLVRVDTRTEGVPRAASYSAWHPDGKFVAFAWNHVCQFFHTAGQEPREVIDVDSGIALYSLERNTVTTAPAIDDPNRLETFPAWSPDGKWLYFCSAPIRWAERKPVPYPYVESIRYDLVRAPFNAAAGTWGPMETVLSAKQAGRNLLEPRLSPDGHFLLFVMCDYGASPVMQANSDLYLMDLLRPGRPYRRLQPAPESWRDSWHSWSSNGRWVVFARKRDYGLVARPYLCYIDAQGNAGKPLVVPQEDPTYYDRCIDTFNAPELVDGPVRFSRAALSRAANAAEKLKAGG